MAIDIGYIILPDITRAIVYADEIRYDITAG